MMATRIPLFRLGQRTYQFHFKIGFFFLSLSFFILFCSLGIWQLYRYQFKQTLLATYQARSTETPLSLTALATESDLQFHRVETKGQFDNSHTMLMQNQLHNGQIGYEVFTPLRIAGEKKRLLVDRGWISSKNIRSIPTAQQNTLTGYIKLPNEHPFILGKNIYSKQFPLVMQTIQFAEIESIMQEAFFPFILRLTSQSDDGLSRDWVITSVLPEKHLGYSVQWFLMAIAIAIAFFCFCCEPLKK